MNDPRPELQRRPRLRHPHTVSKNPNRQPLGTPGLVCQGGGVERPPEEESVGQASTIGLDIAKRIFQAHGADASGRVVFRKKLARAKVLEFFASLSPCVVAMEACGGAPYLARAVAQLGHAVKLVPPKDR